MAPGPSGPPFLLLESTCVLLGQATILLRAFVLPVSLDCSPFPELTLLFPSSRFWF